MVCKTANVTTTGIVITINKPTAGVYEKDVPLEIDVDLGTDKLGNPCDATQAASGEYYTPRIRLVWIKPTVETENIFLDWPTQRYYTKQIDTSALSTTGSYYLEVVLSKCYCTWVSTFAGRVCVPMVYPNTHVAVVEFTLAGPEIKVADVYIKDSVTNQVLTDVLVDKSVNVDVYLANNGNASGSATVRITINGEEVASVTKTIDAYQSWKDTVWSGSFTTVGTVDVCAEIV